MDARRKRINRLKKIIIITVLILILVPIVLCIILFAKLNYTKSKLEDVEEKLDNLIAMRDDGEIIEKTNEETGEVFYVYAAANKELKAGASQDAEEAKKVYLTIDDGPSAMTDKILEILDSYNVKATFFVNGRTDEASIEAYKKIVNAGHSIGIHTYSHNYDSVYASVESFASEVDSLRNLIKDVTGKDTNLFRFPGGSSTTLAKNTGIRPLIDYLNQNGYVYFDWNVSSGDSTAGGLSAEQIVANVTNHVGEFDTPVVLMHDSAAKATTVEALPYIIENLLNMGYEICAIDEDTTPVQHVIK
ncbi:MAG: polysaccharide deacetylase [Parasporobacterium sp.]|nr:polysaccharide deacetylase [Parasporobacterium sp.]